MLDEPYVNLLFDMVSSQQNLFAILAEGKDAEEALEFRFMGQH